MVALTEGIRHARDVRGKLNLSLLDEGDIEEGKVAEGVSGGAVREIIAMM